jgi:tetratricopeptide (TPR) repeat protein
MRVPIRVLPLVALLLGFTPGMRAQFEKQNPMQLIVRVCLDSYQNSAPANLTVQLRDGFGGLEHEGHTDTRGVVEFSTFTASKRLRVYGPGIIEHEETIEIEPVEVRKMIMVIVKTDVKHPSPILPAGIIPSSRLLVPDKAQKEFQKGSDALAKKNWAEAKTHFDSAIAIYPDYDVAYNGLGMALASTGDSKTARPAFERAIRLNENFAEAYRNLARISLSERNFEEMNNLLTRALSADPLNAWALAYVAYAELQLHEFNEALAHAQKAHTVEHKGLASTHTVAALALEALNRQPEAISEYELYLQEDPNGRDAARAKDKIARLKAGKAPL